MAATVTLDKVYLETLLRRAEFHTSGRDLTTPIHLPTVTIPKTDHDNLLRRAQEYSMSFVDKFLFKSAQSLMGDANEDNLRESLYRGGITPETLEILIHGEGAPLSEKAPEESEPDNGGVSVFSRPEKRQVKMSRDPHEFEDYLKPSTPPRSWVEEPSWGAPKPRPGLSNQGNSFQGDCPFMPDFDSRDPSPAHARPERPFYARAEQRTILLKGLPEKTTHKDILSFLKGGIILDVFLRPNERSASVSFVEGSAAQQFLSYAKRNDIYVHGKRLEVQWNDRQFILPGHVANKIGMGATRNLVIRKGHTNITEQRLREDLDHIHNLVIVGIIFQNGDIHIELNSIHNSLFARTCMMSRLVYKGMKIEWYPDKCASPLPKTQWCSRKENRATSPAKKPSPAPNRFEMLMMDGEEEGSSEDEGPTNTTLSGLSNLNINPRNPWNHGPIAA